MADNQAQNYVKLSSGTRRSIAAVSYTSLWLSADHLLQVEGTRFSEDYKRFYFKDIKAVTLRRTPTWGRTNWICLGLAILVMGLFAAFAVHAAPNDRGPFLVIGICIAAIFLLFGFINLLLGPTCVCHLLTAVQQEELPSLKRLRRARKVLNRIREAVESTQGKLTGEAMQEIAARMANAQSAPAGSFQLPPTRVPPLLPKHSSLRWNVGLLAALLTSMLMEVLSILGQRGMLTFSVNAIANCALAGISIATLVRNAPPSKAWAWVRVGLWGIWCGVGMVYGTIASIQYSMKHPGKQADLGAINSMLPESYYLAMKICVGTYLLWALFEVFVLVRAKRQQSSPPPVPLEVVASLEELRPPAQEN